MDLIEFLTSKEIIVVYMVALVACVLCFIIYLVEKNNAKARQRHNTKELNKLVSQVQEEIKDEEVETINYEVPVLETIEEEVIEPVVIEETQEVVEPLVVEEEIKQEILEPVSSIEEADLEYTTIEPDVETAKNELQKITEELKEQQEEIEELQDENIKLTSYEEEQEENAIISLEELVKKSKDMYEANEITQYADEGNEPISLSELEQRVGKEASPVTEPFTISEVVSEEEVQEELNKEFTQEIEKVVLDDFNTIKTKAIEESKNEVKKFKSSPIISPIYGIEKKEVVNEMQLENTADYEKLDAEIKKTNEFLMTLRELQSKLD